METVFDSADLPVDDRVGAWVETTALALVTTKFKSLDPTTFGARLQAMQLGPTQVTSMAYGPLVSQRTPALIRQSDPEQYQLALIRTGCQGIEQARSSALLEPGDLVFYDSSRPFVAAVESGPAGRSESVLVQFPKRLLPLPHADRLLATPLSGTHGVGHLLARFMTTLADEPERFTPQDATRLGGIALDLATATLAHHLDGETIAPSRSPGDVLFLRITSFIDQHLHLRELGPSTVAAAHQISLRYLHRIFQQHGASVGAYIRHRRLDRCRHDLAEPSLRHLTIHAIANRWGFAQPSDFTRAFRSATGMTPSQYRAATRAAGTPVVR
ncbi:helix-turn-helix domain-containing protein [Streptomyces sp. SID3343]|uniref:AraC-like ligand-binding domain-containing protein n=1 Tax=Streptomyces sp. SID3343 TaxID=2690260 RepID=UPI00136B0D40|nr:helix-turn-helix domain-containing protein [Streptomyces sp. SID3343]MYV97758.1 helix-turn-helix domain-containing protein [Streptomyces sp. SID3343]